MIQMMLALLTSSQDSQDDSDEGFARGDVVGVKQGVMLHPTVVACKADIPVKLQKSLFRNIGNIIIVIWYGSKEYSWIKFSIVDTIGKQS